MIKGLRSAAENKGIISLLLFENDEKTQLKKKELALIVWTFLLDGAITSDIAIDALFMEFIYILMDYI